MAKDITKGDDGQWHVETENGAVKFVDYWAAEAYASALTKTPDEAAQILDNLDFPKD